ncbi:raffinose/stachyose/melibiose transport system substrate-binding protein [Paenibacillus anaericanus]|uniref:ABC transporter substrate-binding protein n=1 Tax=Paenibacillus anaericanus TaxID=170367 RepID=UPI00277FF5BC|nr:extracellular solute-binding protein [Paenibacillus anaericanus]MDQ0087411.1 raffinose/stachyose/melibiose transport system substrate-binding protein [Paenibacillus anaericanus]
MRKVMLMLLTSVVVLSLISGCAGGGSTSKNEGSSSDKGTSSEEKVTIKLMDFKTEITDKIKAMAADYMAENPTINIEAQVTGNYDTLLKTRFAAGDGPDIFMTRAYTDIEGWSERLADLSNEPWMDKVIPSSVAGMTADGKKLGFPLAVEGYGFIYNKDIFAQVGIDKLPTTLTELKEVNEKFKAAGISSYTEGYKSFWVLGQHLFNLPFAFEKDPAATIEKMYAGEVKMKDIEKLNGFFDVLDMTVDYGKGTDTIGLSYDNQVSDFASGKTAMMQQGVWSIDAITKINPDMNIGMFAIPLSDNPEETKMPVGVSTYYSINKDSKVIEESKKFLTWLHENGQKYIVDSYKMIPAFTDLKTTPELGPLAEDLDKYLKDENTYIWAFQLWPSGIAEDFTVPLQAYVGGHFDKDQTIMELQKIWDQKVRK